MEKRRIVKEVYPTIFTLLEDEKDTVLIEVPDLGITTEGFGMADAVEMARDAIGLRGIFCEDEGIELAKPTSIDKINPTNGVFAKEGTSYVTLVDIDFVEYRRRTDTKSVRRNVTIPSWLNHEAEKAHINVSRVLQDALMMKLGVQK